VLALGAPYVKAVCMGRALMIPAFVGKNIGKWIEEDNLPKTVSAYGSTPEQIFVCYEELRQKYGDALNDLPMGAVGLFTFARKLQVGLQQLMAGSRNFRLSTITRDDVMALTEEAAKVSGIPYIMDAYREQADKIIEG